MNEVHLTSAQIANLNLMHGRRQLQDCQLQLAIQNYVLEHLGVDLTHPIEFVGDRLVFHKHAGRETQTDAEIPQPV